MVTAGGTSATSSADQFTYVAMPAVTGVSPAAGPAGGRHRGDDHRHGFTGATAVEFGTTPAAIVSDSADADHGHQPGRLGHGRRDGRHAGGTSATSSADQFTYVPRRR